MINLIRGPPKNPERKIEARASNCADTVGTVSFWLYTMPDVLVKTFWPHITFGPKYMSSALAYSFILNRDSAF